ncbi:MAG: DUF1801 domain-containing protein [Treponema sp.]|nr:DUF1801 domain-containing protein [Treponema sp.]
MTVDASGNGMADEALAVEAYLEKLPPETREIFLEIRKIVRTVVPESRELIKWGVVGHYLDGRKILLVGASKNHLGVYGLIPEAFRDRLRGYGQSKGCIRFPYKEPIPYDLIEDLVRHEAGTPGGKTVPR